MVRIQLQRNHLFAFLSERRPEYFKLKWVYLQFFQILNTFETFIANNVNGILTKITRKILKVFSCDREEFASTSPCNRCTTIQLTYSLINWLQFPFSVFNLFPFLSKESSWRNINCLYQQTGCKEECETAVTYKYKILSDFGNSPRLATSVISLSVRFLKQE